MLVLSILIVNITYGFERGFVSGLKFFLRCSRTARVSRYSICPLTLRNSSFAHFSNSSSSSGLSRTTNAFLALSFSAIHQVQFQALLLCNARHYATHTLACTCAAATEFDSVGKSIDTVCLYSPRGLGFYRRTIPPTNCLP